LASAAFTALFGEKGVGQGRSACKVAKLQSVIVVSFTIRSLIARDGVMRDAMPRFVFCNSPAAPSSRVCRDLVRFGRPAIRLAVVLLAVGGGGGLGPMAPAVAQAGEVLEFSGPGCLACQRMSPLVEKLKRQGYPIRVIDIRRAPRLARQLDIKLLPTFVLIDAGRAVKKIVGVTSETQLRSLAEAARAGNRKPADADPGPSVSARLTKFTEKLR